MDLGSAPVPGLQPDDHVRGDERAALVILYADFECPICAVAHARLRAAPVRLVFRHFPVRTRRPRSWPAAQAAEAAALQGSFWEMHDSLFGDQGRLEDPHLWARCEDLGLDLARFESDRRSDAVIARVQRDFEAGARAGVVSTPTLFVEGVAHPGVPEPGLLAQLEVRHGADPAS
jgi:protein-disulfide isomerase